MKSVGSLKENTDSLRSDLTQTNAELANKVNKSDLTAPPIWNTLSLLNWVTGTLKYSKSIDGLVTIAISFIRNTTDHITIGTMPVGYRPGNENSTYRLSAVNNAGVTSKSCSLRIFESGTIYVFYADDNPANTEFSGTIHYWAEQ